MSETPPEPEPFVSLQDLATFLRAPQYAQPGNDNRELLQEVLDAAIEVVEHRVGPLSGASVPYTVHATGRNLVLPVTQLTEITSVVDPDGIPVDLEHVDLNLLSGIVGLHSSSRRGAYTVTARTTSGGASLRLAVKIIASHLWEVQRGSAAGGGRFSQPVADGTPPAGRGFAIPARAAQLIAPFERVGGLV
jgi:hypothetical protein